MPVHRRAARGIGRTFQNVGLVKGSTALENLLTAQHLEVGYDTLAGMFGVPKRSTRKRSSGGGPGMLLECSCSKTSPATRAADLPYGVLKRLEIAAGARHRPRLVAA